MATTPYTSPVSTPNGLLAQSAVAKAGTVLVDRARSMLDGTPAQRGWRTAEGVVFHTEQGVAVVDLQSAQMLLTVGRQVVDAPGVLPAELCAQVAELLTTLEARLGSGASGWVHLNLEAGAGKVVEFLRQQARIREMLPLRTLQRCVTCKLEKVVNPDYARLAERNRKLKVFSSSFGGIITGHGISPYVLIGKLIQAKKLDPDYVCPRCQGMEADTRIVTFCPGCHARRDEPMLRICPDCKHDFRADLPAEVLWREEQATTPAGWYPDPWAPGRQLRWWAGSTWTQHAHAL
jgi:hypothetical protein